jgi:hypothetical protein
MLRLLTTLALFDILASALAGPAEAQNTTTGSCSPIITQNQSPVSVDCSGRTRAEPVAKIDCSRSQFPEVVPNGSFRELQIYALGAELISYAQRPGAAMPPRRATTSFDVEWCKFINFGDRALINVEAAIDVRLFKVVQNDAGSGSGDIVSSHFVRTNQFDLGAGESFDFYVWNRSPYFAQVVLPDSAEGLLAGAEKRERFHIVPAQRRSFTFPPGGDDQ